MRNLLRHFASRLAVVLAKLDAEAPDAGLPIGEWRRRRESAEAQLKDLELRKLEGSLLDVEETRSAWSCLIIAARAKFLLMPDELGDRIAACSDPVRCRLMIEDKIHAALQELSEGGGEATKTRGKPARKPKAPRKA